ncbi:endonuclease domain-containing protein [Paenibacillus hamazuiensis]|uniref:endonuclease domain-containing protein n=1 Tax=Paenibacillus hamazuiensis TaxID=2936508 RepID=UPI00200C79DE|nr:endonuclease domain-containing protein [Paenibacillus hamazuiensis]
MAFQSAYNLWMEGHLHKSKGERRRRLIEGHGHAEKLFLEQVWYPAYRHFENLHPEYEVADFRDGTRYLDFAFLQFPVRLAVEIDGYGPHSAKQSRWQFADSLMRQNHLVIDGWRILRFSYDDVNEKPRTCQQVLQQFMGSRLGADRFATESNIIEAEVLRLALRLDRFLRPRDVCELLQIKKDKAHRILHSMLRKKSLLPAGEGELKIRCYKVNRDRIDERSWQL